METQNGYNRAHGTAKRVAYCAVSCALLIAAQYALSFISGVEAVTVLLLSFCAYFGVACGLITAVSFCFLRCFIFGFYPQVIVLYLIYYPLFAITFGLLGKIKCEKKVSRVAVLVAVNALLIILGGLCGVSAGLKLIKISVVYQTLINALLWVICGICGGLLIFFNIVWVKHRNSAAGAKILITVLFCAVAAAFTVMFTLLDDVISPLMLGMRGRTALAYFYSSFLAMVPQVICALVSVFILYRPITFALLKACGGKTY